MTRGSDDRSLSFSFEPSMIACLDVDYRDPLAVAACVLLERWDSSDIAGELTTVVHDVAPYVPGSFYLRELPCLLAVLKLAPPLEAVVIDAYVDVAPNAPGLGRHLYEAIHLPVVGVAKTQFVKATHAVEVLRGESKTPLYVTAAGIDPQVAANYVRQMAGEFRIPEALRRVDRLCRETVLAG